MNKYLQCLTAAVGMNLALGFSTVLSSAKKVSLYNILEAYALIMIDATPTAIAVTLTDKLLNQQLTTKQHFQYALTALEATIPYAITHAVVGVRKATPKFGNDAFSPYMTAESTPTSPLRPRLSDEQPLLMSHEELPMQILALSSLVQSIAFKYILDSDEAEADEFAQAFAELI